MSRLLSFGAGVLTSAVVFGRLAKQATRRATLAELNLSEIRARFELVQSVVGDAQRSLEKLLEREKALREQLAQAQEALAAVTNAAPRLEPACVGRFCKYTGSSCWSVDECPAHKDQGLLTFVEKLEEAAKS